MKPSLAATALICTGLSHLTSNNYHIPSMH